ncbi:MAG TPA: hypothetical protein DDX19_08755 [Rhodopirellula baltica]|nr:hypothetical protein [Rhodopirellula baltica]
MFPKTSIANAIGRLGSLSEKVAKRRESAVLTAENVHFQRQIANWAGTRCATAFITQLPHQRSRQSIVSICHAYSW